MRRVRNALGRPASRGQVVFLALVLVVVTYYVNGYLQSRRTTTQQAFCAILNEIGIGRDTGIDQARADEKCGPPHPNPTFFGQPQPSKHSRSQSSGSEHKPPPSDLNPGASHSGRASSTPGAGVTAAPPTPGPRRSATPGPTVTRTTTEPAAPQPQPSASGCVLKIAGICL